VSEEAATSERNVSLTWRLASYIEKWWVQAAAIALVFAVTYYFSRDGRFLAVYVHISPDGALQFLSGLSQALAALLAVSLAFLIFEMEGVDRERSNAFEVFRSQMNKLFELIRSRPTSELTEFDGVAIMIADEFAALPREQLPLRIRRRRVADRSTANSGDDPWERWVQELLKADDKLRDEAPDLSETLYRRQVLLSMAKAEDALNRLQMQELRAVVSALIVRVIVKVALLLGVSLLLLLGFGTTVTASGWPDWSLPVLFALLAWVLVTLLEMMRRARFYYRSFVEG
jgi:hypothetical protein